MKKYVVGFMFSEDMKKVALIRKLKPKWQENRLNGIGGSIEEGEASIVAMRREFLEEAGVLSDWQQYLTMAVSAGDGQTTEAGCTVDFYAAIGPLDALKSITREQVEIHEVDELSQRTDLVETILWAVLMGLESIRTGVFATAIYP